MKLEVEAGIELIKRFISRNDSLSDEHVNSFCRQAQQLIMQKFEGHWHDEDLIKGNGFRCLRINGQNPIEPTLLNACQIVGIQYKDLRLPRELTLWIDPGEVSCRIGETRSQHFLIATVSKDGLHYVDNRAKDIDIDDAERRHVESVRRAKDDLFSTSVSSRQLNATAERVPTNSSYCSSLDNTSSAGDSLIMPFNNTNTGGDFENSAEKYRGPLSSPPAVLLNARKQHSNGHANLSTWNGADSHKSAGNSDFYADVAVVQHGNKTTIASVATNNNAVMRGRANSYRNGVGNGVRQHNSLSSSSPNSDSNSNLSTSSSTPPLMAMQAAPAVHGNSRFSPLVDHHHNNNNHSAHQQQQPKRQQNISGGGFSLAPAGFTATSSAYSLAPALDGNTPVTVGGGGVGQPHHYAVQHYNYQRQQIPMHPHHHHHPNSPFHPTHANAFFPTSMASGGPGLMPHQLFMNAAQHNASNIMLHHHHPLHHPFAIVGHHPNMAPRGAPLFSSD